MSTRRLRLCQQHMDRPAEMTTVGVAVLFGTTIAELGKWVDLDGDSRAPNEVLPAWLHQQGQRRSREAQAAVDGRSATEALTHWAIRDFGAGVLGFDMVTTEAVHQLWMIVTPEVADQIAGRSEKT